MSVPITKWRKPNSIGGRRKSSACFRCRLNTQSPKPSPQLCSNISLVEEHFQEIIDGMEMDLKFNRYEDFKQLQLYCYRVASVVGLLSAQIFGFQHRKTLKYAHDLGMAFQLTNIIRDVGEDARRGRIYLSLDELRKAGVSEDDILQGHETEAVKTLMLFQIERAESFYDKALSELPKEDTKQQRTD